MRILRKPFGRSPPCLFFQMEIHRYASFGQKRIYKILIHRRVGQKFHIHRSANHETALRVVVGEPGWDWRNLSLIRPQRRQNV